MYLMGDFLRDVYPAEEVDKLDFFRFPIIGASAPTVLVFIFLQRYFIEGLTLGAAKG